MLDIGYLNFIVFLSMIAKLKTRPIQNINIYNKRLALYSFICYKNMNII